MRAVRAWFVRLGEFVFRQRRDMELAAEIDSHLQMHIADGVRSGLSPEEARRQALLALGGVDQTMENYRDHRGFPVFEAAIQDLRFGLRLLRKNPGFTAVAAAHPRARHRREYGDLQCGQCGFAAPAAI